jgi:hypothetical protein
MIALIKFLVSAAQFVHHLRVLDRIFHLDMTLGTFLMVSLPIFAALIGVAVVMARAEKRASGSIGQTA